MFVASGSQLAAHQHRMPSSELCIMCGSKKEKAEAASPPALRYMPIVWSFLFPGHILFTTVQESCPPPRVRHWQSGRISWTVGRGEPRSTFCQIESYLFVFLVHFVDFCHFRAFLFPGHILFTTVQESCPPPQGSTLAEWSYFLDSWSW